MHKIINSESSQTIPIKIDTLDNFTDQNKINKIDLIKLVVEGYEMKVLKGCQRVIYKFRPILYIELDDKFLKEQESSAKHLIEFLEENQYYIIRADNNCEISSKNDYTNCHYDIVCLPNKLN